MLDPFPYADSHRLAVLVRQDPSTRTDGQWAWLSSRDLQSYQELSNVFEEVIGAAGGDDVLMKRAEGTVPLFGVWVTSNFFRVLGVPTLMGRPLSHEDAKPGAPPVVVLSFKGWRSHFLGDAAVVGRTFVMDNQPTTVIGVMPPRFHWLGADFWLPATLSRDKTTDQSRSYAYSVVGGLKPGKSKGGECRSKGAREAIGFSLPGRCIQRKLPFVSKLFPLPPSDIFGLRSIFF